MDDDDDDSDRRNWCGWREVKLIKEIHGECAYGSLISGPNLLPLAIAVMNDLSQ